VSTGLFISFEGPDGSGKSTQADMLALTLRKQGMRVVETREPGGTPVGEQVRHVLLAPGGAPMTPLVMALLLSASRAQLVQDVIRPALDTGETVICDRYADSTLAYQGYGMGLDLDAVATLTKIATQGLRPALTVYVDVTPEVGLARIAARGGVDRLDGETLEFHRRVRNGYLALMDQDRDRWIRIDGTQSPDRVHAEVVRAVHSRLLPQEDIV
jgi:dTMP kinase